MSNLLTQTGFLDHHRDVIRTVFPNGLTLLVRPDRSASVVAIVTHVRAGYFDEDDEHVGVAHVLEHMYFKGTPTRGPGELARETKLHGGYLNAHTIYDHTTYYTVLPATALTAGMDLQFDAFANSVIDEEELARELEVIIQEVKRKRDRPSAVTVESLYGLLYDRHRIRRWRMGEEVNLKAFTLDDVKLFKWKWYQPDNTILTVVGDVDPDEVYAEVLKRYGALRGEATEHMTGPQEVSEPGLRHREISGDFQQQHVALGWRIPPLAHSDSAALELAGVIHGSGRASRLYRSVRERNLATSVSAWSYTTSDAGAFVAMAEAPPTKARAATAAIWQDLAAARDEGVGSSEVRRAQQVLEARWLRRLESMEGQALYLSYWEAMGGLDKASDYYHSLQSIDAGDVQRVMQTYLTPETVSVVSCKPDSAQPLAVDIDELRSFLDSSIKRPRAAVLTPIHPLAAVSSAPAPVKAESSAPTPIDVVDSQPRLSGGAFVFQTQSGVPVLVIPREGAAIAHLGVFVETGAASGDSFREGLARLTAHSLLKGTLDRSGNEVAELAESMGSSIAVSTGLERTSWTMAVPTRHVQAAFELLGDVIQRPAFATESINTERALALENVARLRDDMYRWPMAMAMQAAFGSHPYARSVGGNAESVAAIEREEVLAWHQHHILHSPSIIAITGAVDPLRVAEWCSETFSTLQYCAADSVPTVHWPDERRSALELRKTKQSALALVFPGPSQTHAMRFPVRVMSAMATGLGGRLFSRLRDQKSLAYTVSAHSVEYGAGGAIVLYIATSPDRVDEARDELLSEAESFGKDEAQLEEVARARNYLIGTRTIARQSGASLLSEYVDAWILRKNLEDPLREASQIEAVSPDDVVLAAREFLRVGCEAEALVGGIVSNG